ncbi:OmpA family protein [Roseimicrobium gellanilyticum]|nr:OmpA family protein [Roseimicrobium gellanilyticum]
MSRTRRNRFHPHGGALGPILLILVALAISGAVFFFFTKKKIDAQREAAMAEQAAAEAAAQQAVNAPGAAAQTPGAGTQAAGQPAAAPAPAPAPVLGFARPVDVAEQLARSMMIGDLPAAAKIISGGDPSQEAGAMAALNKIKELGYKPVQPDLIQTIGQVGPAVRLGIPLIKAGGGQEQIRIQIDVQKDPDMGWKVGTVRLPKELEQVMAAVTPPVTAPPTINPQGGAPIPPSTPAAKPLFVLEARPDAIVFASDFVGHLLKLDYDAVNRLVDSERVPPMKVAGLCIVFEDGKYKLAGSKPLVVTVATENTSWIIAKVQSDLLKEETEFGLELEKKGDGWRVIGLNLSKLLADNARSSTAAGVPYTPLVQNPKGGESIALYYEYDSDILHPRAQTQLKIIASILKNSPTRKIKIGGHTDALGADAYNLALSKKRADAVKQFFLDEGVPVAQIETIGFGKANPLSPNVKGDGTDNPEGRSRNRRAEILLDF